MNAISDIKPPTHAAKPVGQVFNWRGKCIGHYAKAEWSVSCLLLLLSNKCETNKLPHLSGAKSAALRERLKEIAKTDEAASTCLGQLDLWSDLERERDWIAHGHFDFAHNDQFGWVLIAQMLVFANGRLRPTSPSIPANDLGAFEKRLSFAVKALCAELDRMAVAIAGSEQKLRQALYSPSSRAP